MATHAIVTLVCDGCGTDDQVETRRLTIGTRRTRKLEACDQCWSVVLSLYEAGRPVR